MLNFTSAPRVSAARSPSQLLVHPFHWSGNRPFLAAQNTARRNGALTSYQSSPKSLTNRSSSAAGFSSAAAAASAVAAASASGEGSLGGAGSTGSGGGAAGAPLDLTRAI